MNENEINTLANPSVKLWHKKTVHSDRRPYQPLRFLIRYLEHYGLNPEEIMQTWKQVRYDYKNRQIFLDEMTEQIENYYYNLYLMTMRQPPKKPCV